MLFVSSWQGLGSGGLRPAAGRVQGRGVSHACPDPAECRKPDPVAAGSWPAAGTGQVPGCLALRRRARPRATGHSPRRRSLQLRPPRASPEPREGHRATQSCKEACQGGAALCQPFALLYFPTRIQHDHRITE